MDNDHFWILMARHLAGETTAKEEETLKALLKESPEYKLRYEAIQSYWGDSKQRTEAELEQAYKHVSAKLDRNGNKSASRIHGFFPFMIKVAAILLILVSAGLYISSFTSTALLWINLTWNVKQNGQGERSKLTLSDGSTVWLNAESKLKYPAEFESETREVFLTGEAFFDVAKNPGKPFIIHLKNGDVRVLGTSFNVKAFEDDALVETSVVTGKVAFIPRKAAGQKPDTILLTPNFKAVYAKNSGKAETKKTDSSEDKAWTDGRLVFKSARFEEIGKVLERAYGKKVIFESPLLQNCRLTGTFQNNSLEEIMTLFGETKDYQFSITKSELRIKGTGCSEAAQ